MDKNYLNNLERTAKINTLLVLLDDYRKGGSVPTLTSIYFFLKENSEDRDVFIKLLQQIPENIIAKISALAEELKDLQFQAFLLYHDVIASNAPSSCGNEFWHIGMDF